MKKFLLFLFLFGFVFAASFFLARYLDLSQPIEKKESPPQSSQPSSFVLKNHPFVIVIVGYNNGASAAKTLSSVFFQKYENYRVIYIDDASSDGSYDFCRDIIYDSSELGRFTIVRNEARLGTLANICRAVQTCADEEIVVLMQGEDRLAHEWVLERLNAYYADPDLWLTYGQYCDYPTYQMGICHGYKERLFRHQPFFASHLKTFYAALFKKVREADFIYQGKFLPACADMAIMVPMLEMAKDHFRFIPEVLYIANRESRQKEDREMQMRCEKVIRALDSYPSLTTLQVAECGK